MAARDGIVDRWVTSVAGQELTEQALEDLVTQIPQGDWQGSRAFDTVVRVLSAVRRATGRAGFNAGVVLALAAIVHRAPAPETAKAVLRPFVGVAPELIERVLGNFDNIQNGGQLRDRLAAGRPDGAGGGRSVQVPDGILIIAIAGEQPSHATHRGGKHPHYAREITRGPETPDLRKQYSDAGFGECNICFTASERAAIVIEPPKKATITFGQRIAEMRALTTPTRGGTDPNVAADFIVALISHCDREIAGDPMNGLGDAGGRQLREDIILVVERSSPEQILSEMIFPQSADWQNQMAERDAQLNVLCAYEIAYFRAEARSIRAAPDAKEATGFAGFVKRIADTFGFSGDAIADGLDRWFFSSTQDEREDLIPRLYRGATESFLHPLVKALTRLAMWYVTPAILCAFALPILAWWLSMPGWLVTIATVVLAVAVALAPMIFANAVSDTITTAYEDAFTPIIPGEGATRFRTPTQREGRYNAAVGHARLGQSGKRAAGILLSIYVGTLLASCVAVIGSGTLSLIGAFNWVPTWTLVVATALFYIPMLVLDIGGSMLHGVLMTLVGFVPDDSLRARLQTQMGRSATYLWNEWKDVGLKVVNGLMLGNLVLVLIWWPVYPFDWVPTAMMALGGPLLVSSWYLFSLTTIRRNIDTTAETVRDVVREFQVSMARGAVRLITGTAFITIALGWILMGLNGGAVINANASTGAIDGGSAASIVVKAVQGCPDAPVLDAVATEPAICAVQAALGNKPAYCDVGQHPACERAIRSSLGYCASGAHASHQACKDIAAIK